MPIALPMPPEQATHEKNRCDRAMDRLTNAGLRRTKFRSNPLTLLIASEPYALSVAEIQSHPSAKRPDTVAIYRNIEALNGIGLLDRVTDEKGGSRYQLKETEGPNLMIACRDCHATFVHSSPVLSELESVARNLGYSGISSRWEITGYCEDCTEQRTL